MTPAERLQVFADTHFKSVSGLARAAGVHKQQMLNYSGGKNAPGLEVLIKLQAVGLNLNWLANGSGPMKLMAEGIASERTTECERVLEEIVAKVEQYRAKVEDEVAAVGSSVRTRKLMSLEELKKPEKVRK